MRNYISLQLLAWNQDGVDGAAELHFDIDNGSPATAVANDVDDLWNQVQIVNQSTKDSFPSYTWTFTYPKDPIATYILLDKANILKMMQTLSSFVWQNSQALPADQWISMLSNPEKSPRYTGWKDSAGETRKPDPNEKKGATSGGFLLQEVDALTQFSRIYSILVRLPNPVPALKNVLADLLAVIRLLAAKRATQSDIDRVNRELTNFFGGV